MVTALLSAPAPPPEQTAPEGLPLDANERAAVDTFVQAGLVDPGDVAGLRAGREPWGAYRAVS